MRLGRQLSWKSIAKQYLRSRIFFNYDMEDIDTKKINLLNLTSAKVKKFILEQLVLQTNIVCMSYLAQKY